MPEDQDDSERVRRTLAAGQWRVVRKPDGGLLACVTWMRSDGNGARATLMAELSPTELGAIARTIRERMHERLDGAVAGRSFLRNVSRFARRIARARVLRKLAEGAAQVIRSPILASAVGIVSFVPGIGTGIAAAYGASRVAVELIDRARRGDRQAQARLAAMAQQAAAGSPAAQRAMPLVQEAAAQLSRQAQLRTASAGDYMASGHTSGLDYIASGYVAAGSAPYVASGNDPYRAAPWTPPRERDGALQYGGRTMMLRAR